MKTIILFPVCLFILTLAAHASTKDDSRLKAAEQAFREKKYADSKAVFEDLKSDPRYREKSYLYLAMIYYETGQVESALDNLKNFRHYITEATDISLKTSAANLTDEIHNSYSTLDMALFREQEKASVDPGYYSLIFSSRGGLNAAQEARLKIINRVLAQSLGIFSWKSDGTFLKGKINYFPLKLYDAEAMTAEINGIPIYFRFDFQTKQGLWMPHDALKIGEQFSSAQALREGLGPISNTKTLDDKTKSTLVVIGAAAGAVLTAAAISIF